MAGVVNGIWARTLRLVKHTMHHEPHMLLVMPGSILLATFFIVENALDSRQSVRDKHPIYQMEYIVKRDSDVVLTEHNKNRYSV